MTPKERVRLREAYRAEADGENVRTPIEADASEERLITRQSIAVNDHFAIRVA